jgi:hypothetical protein
MNNLRWRQVLPCPSIVAGAGRSPEAEINEIIVGQPTYGYRRVHALIRRRRREQGGAAVDTKRVYGHQGASASARAPHRQGHRAAA